MDANKDGRITAEEHAASAKQMFNTMEADQDCKVTAIEMQAALETGTGKKADKSDFTAADKINVVDADGDGVLTATKQLLRAWAMFKKMDLDNSSFLTSGAFAAGHARMRKNHAP